MESASHPEGRTNKRQHIGPAIGHDTAIARIQLETCFRNHFADLAQMLRPHILQMGLATNRADAERLAFDVLSEAYLEVERSPQNYNITLSAKAWIVGLALNLLRRRRTESSRRAVREVPLGPDDAAALIGEVNDAIRDDMGDRFIFRLLVKAAVNHSQEPHECLAQEQAETEYDLLLKQVLDLIPTLDPMDQGVLTANLQTNFDCSTTARLLGIRPGAARTRLHRAIRRLRDAYLRVYPHRAEDLD